MPASRHRSITEERSFCSPAGASAWGPEASSRSRRAAAMPNCSVSHSRARHSATPSGVSMRSGCAGTWVVDIGVDVLPLEHVADRSGEYGQVEPEGLAVDVFHVQRLAAFPGDVVASVDLCESGDAGLNV